MKKRFIVEFYKRFRKSKARVFYSTARNYLLFPNDNAVTSSLINGWEYEPYFFDFLSDNLIDLSGCDVIDIGANNGIFTVEFADLVGDNGRVFSFEPQRIIFQQLCGNIFANGFDNVWAFNIAVGSYDGLVKMEVPNYYVSETPINLGDVSVQNKTSRTDTEEVQIIRLDSLEFLNLILIKIDVQGYECEVIEGAKETISKHRPFLYIEVEPTQLAKFDRVENDLFSLMESLGYLYRRFRENETFFSSTGKCLDCVFIPQEKTFTQSFLIR